MHLDQLQCVHIYHIGFLYLHRKHQFMFDPNTPCDSHKLSFKCMYVWFKSDQDIVARLNSIAYVFNLVLSLIRTWCWASKGHLGWACYSKYNQEIMQFPDGIGV